MGAGVPKAQFDPQAPSAYEHLGASATKRDIHAALPANPASLFPGAFCALAPDLLGGDPDWCCAVHADGAGTKVLVAYLYYQETKDPSWFRGIAQDALVMNLDDLLCIGACDRFLLGNSIGRNGRYIPTECLREILLGYQDCQPWLADYGIEIIATGGETADLPDLVRTLVVDATLTTRLPRHAVIDNARIQPGDVIVGISSTGQASYESAPNSGIGANGLTLARHALLAHEYAKRYPEAVDPEIAPNLIYRGPFRLHDQTPGLEGTIGAALLSPTRSYAPFLRPLLLNPQLHSRIHGMIHCTGGGLTKCLRFGTGICYHKNQLFPTPPLLELIQQIGGITWHEMYQTFNMGHRLEIYTDADTAATIIAHAAQFHLEAQIIGRCEVSHQNQVLVTSEHGTFHYDLNS